MIGYVRRLLLSVFVCFSLTAAQAKEEYRALWVDVFHEGLFSPAQVDTLVATARAANYNALILQVRKACDAYYNGSVEPKNTGLDDGFDPLAYVIRAAHDTSGGKQRLEVHAWLVTYRCRIPSDSTYKSSRHITQRHPEWLNKTISGAAQAGGENAGRQYLDPGVPGVVDYTLEVVRDILQHYDVDGICFDYVRYPESPGTGNIWGYNPISLERFRKLYGRNDKPAADDPQWSEFRRMQVSHLVRKVYAHVRLWRPRVKVSAATITWSGIAKGFESTSAYNNVLQDWRGMALDGWLDIIMPMNYKREGQADQARDHRQWAQYLGALANQSGRFGVNVIDGENLNSLAGITAQMQATRTMPGIAGLATYCYAQTRSGKNKPVDTEFFQTIRQKFYVGPAQVPQADWLERPYEGIVKGVVTGNGKTLDAARVRIGNSEALTDGTGFYAIARLKPGEYSAIVDYGNRTSAPAKVTVAAGRVSELPLTLN